MIFLQAIFFPILFVITLFALGWFADKSWFTKKN